MVSGCTVVSHIFTSHFLSEKVEERESLAGWHVFCSCSLVLPSPKKLLSPREGLVRTVTSSLPPSVSVQVNGPSAADGLKCRWSHLLALLCLFLSRQLRHLALLSAGRCWQRWDPITTALGSCVRPCVAPHMSVLSRRRVPAPLFLLVKQGLASQASATRAR